MESSDETETSEATIVVEGLSKRYGQVEALRGIDFQIGAGEIVGFLGPNGAGKTTTMKILTCFMAASEGEAMVAGFDVRTQSRQVRQAVGYLPENVPLYEEMLVYDYLRFIAEMREVARDQRSTRIEAVADQTGIGDVMGRPIGELSKGFRQRVGLAQAIIHEPEVIILDEPTTGLDPNQIVDIRDVITTIGREKTIIFSTHILQEVTAVCDRLIIIDEGRLVVDGTLRQLEQTMAEAKPGLWVSFRCDDIDEIRTYVQDLDGFDALVDISRRGDRVRCHLKGDEERIRRALFDGESKSSHGLWEVRSAQPTLEEIFRLYTGDAEGHEMTVRRGGKAPRPEATKDSEGIEEVAHG